MLSRLMVNLMKHLKKNTQLAHTQGKDNENGELTTKAHLRDGKIASKESVARSADKIMREHSTALKWLADK